MREIHESIYCNHTGVRLLALKAIRQGYFWPTIKKDVYKFVKQYDKYKRYSSIPGQPRTAHFSHQSIAICSIESGCYWSNASRLGTYKVCCGGYGLIC